MAKIEEIKAYRNAILQAMLNKRDPEDGFPLILEKHARQLLGELTDEELADGILFNTPEEVADLLMEPL